MDQKHLVYIVAAVAIVAIVAMTMQEYTLPSTNSAGAAVSVSAGADCHVVEYTGVSVPQGCERVAQDAYTSTFCC